MFNDSCKKAGTALLLVGAVFLPTLAQAHHSFAMFDGQAETVIEGTVTDFQWTNPHSWIEIDVLDAKGVVTHYSVEGGSPAGLARLGWSRKVIKPGDKIKLVMHPLRDGRPGGSLMGVVLPNGQQLGESLTAPADDKSPRPKLPG